MWNGQELVFSAVMTVKDLGCISWKCNVVKDVLKFVDSAFLSSVQVSLFNSSFLCIKEKKNEKKYHTQFMKYRSLALNLSVF